MKNIAITDEVTNLVNKEYIKKEIQGEIARFTRTHQLFTLVECGMDNLNEVRELHGEDGCNYVLKELAYVVVVADHKQKQNTNMK